MFAALLRDHLNSTFGFKFLFVYPKVGSFPLVPPYSSDELPDFECDIFPPIDLLEELDISKPQEYLLLVDKGKKLEVMFRIA